VTVRVLSLVWELRFLAVTARVLPLALVGVTVRVLSLAQELRCLLVRVEGLELMSDVALV
jgi:hypothetical protein